MESPSEPETDGVFIHISEGYNDAHKALMPLKMATIMADDKDVLIYMDIHVVNLPVKGSENLTHAGFEPGDLKEGIQTAQKDKFFNFTKGRIITLDY